MEKEARRLEGHLAEDEPHELGVQLTAALFLVLVLLGVIGWAFTL